MNCYICQSTSFTRAKGEVRDDPKIKILKCNKCGLVSLDNIKHIDSGFYKNSGMHGTNTVSIDSWLKETELDDQRRYDFLKTMLPNVRLLDFGCGAGGFLLKARNLAQEVTGIEPEDRVRDHWAEQLNILPSVDSVKKGQKFDLITAFHVLEHLCDPRELLVELAELLTNNGRILIEVPNSEDALITLYDCNAFQHFTYWSQHLHLFNSKTLEILVKQAGLRVIAVQHYQRYPISNHLYWLSQNKLGGHKHWAFLDSPEMISAYSNVLAAMGKTDTLTVLIEK